jgi:hypothetical protein
MHLYDFAITPLQYLPQVVNNFLFENHLRILVPTPDYYHTILHTEIGSIQYLFILNLYFI